MKQTADWYQTVEQAQAQFQFWALMSSPLLIAADPGQVEPELIEYWCATKRTHPQPFCLVFVPSLSCQITVL